jgi:arabinogalactan oligomer/maltooligosaccharide transport system permease protein
VFLALLINRTLHWAGNTSDTAYSSLGDSAVHYRSDLAGNVQPGVRRDQPDHCQILHLPIVNWLGSPTEAFLACILTNVWLGFPFMMIVALGGLQSIPQQLYEAAEIDGAGWWTRLTRITLPLLKPVMTPAAVLGMVWTFNNLNVIWLVSNAGEPSDETHILVSFVYKSAFNLYRYSYAAAMSMVIFAILLVFGVSIIRRSRAVEGMG